MKLNILKVFTVACVLAGGVLMNTISGAFASNFSDLIEDHEHYSGMKYLIDIGAMQGYSDGTIRPDYKVNRAEFLKILLEGTDHLRNGIGEYSDCFPDVTSEWYAPYVCYAKSEGLVSGYPDGLFHPENDVTIVESAKILSNLFFKEKMELSDCDNEKTWYQEYIELLSKDNIIPDSISKLDEPLSRSEVALMVWELSDRFAKAGSADIGGFIFSKDGTIFKKMGGYYINNNNVYSYERNEEKYVALNLDLSTFELIDRCYGKDANNVYFFGQLQKEIDAKTFELIDSSSNYLKDKNNIYSYRSCSLGDHKIIEGADYETFEILSPWYAKDKNHVYVNKGEILDADAKTFSLLSQSNGSYAKDNISFFYKGEKIEGLDIPSLEITNGRFLQDKNGVYTIVYDYNTYLVTTIPDIDISTFEVIPNSYYYKDSKNAYYAEGENYVQIIEGVDIESFEDLGGYYLAYYTKDKNLIYFNGKAILDSDGETASLISKDEEDYVPYVKDEKHIYAQGEILAEAEIETFEYLGDGYSKDKDSVFYYNTIIEGADISTFEITRLRYARDKDNLYYEGVKLFN
jgi:hypothetical protein